jgi:hypothetical protein
VNSRRRTFAILLGGAIILLTALLLAAFSNGSAFSGAAEGPLLQATSKPLVQESISSETCLSCHGKPGLVLPLDNGENLNLYVSADDYAHSIHGEKGYACVQCHTTVGNYPHPPFSAKDQRDASIQLYQACKRCHYNQYTLAQDSVHEVAMEAGNRNAAICTDCHTAHKVRQLTEPDTGELLPEARTWIPQTCAQCHSAIYQKYLTSVHGSALVGEGNPDVPTCIDCHGVHNIENPTTAAFRLKSPEICAKCHTDPTIMDKYGIPTQVLNTYVADFHGTTVTLFEKQSPDAPTNKPVCYDCHGVHDIKRPDDPEQGLQIRENLLARCQVCHPDATANFPDAWLSHYIPSPTKTPLVYFVDLFYKFFIPGTLGGMAILVLLDSSSILRKRIKLPIPQRKSRKGKEAEETSSGQAVEASPAADPLTEDQNAPEADRPAPPEEQAQAEGSSEDDSVQAGAEASTPEAAQPPETAEIEPSDLNQTEETPDLHKGEDDVEASHG